MVIYLSGPISSSRDTAPDRFGAAARLLMVAGHTVMNPIDIGTSLQRTLGRIPSEREYLHLDFSYLLMCDAVALLPGWLKSDGAQKEKAIAEWSGIKVAEIEEYLKAKS
jgi:hypothetical protein